MRAPARLVARYYENPSLTAVDPTLVVVDPDEPVAVAISGDGFFETGEIRVRFGETSAVPADDRCSQRQGEDAVVPTGDHGNADDAAASAESAAAAGEGADAPDELGGNIVPATFDEESQIVNCKVHRGVFTSLVGSAGAAPAYAGVAADQSLTLPVFVALNGEDFVGGGEQQLKVAMSLK